MNNEYPLPNPLIWGRFIEVEFVRDETNHGTAGSLIKYGGTMFYKGRIIKFMEDKVVPFRKGYFYVTAIEMRPWAEIGFKIFRAVATPVLRMYYRGKLWMRSKTR